MFVVTGGPGSGKTTLCGTLAARGLNIVPESGRAVIQEQVKSGGMALPWIDPTAFAKAVFARDKIHYYVAIGQSGTCLFDRAFPDNAGYLTMLGLPVPRELETLCRTCRFSNPILVAPPWSEIYGQDSERKQSWEEAVATHAAMVAAYQHYGYEMIELPCTPVAERAAFVLNVINGD